MSNSLWQTAHRSATYGHRFPCSWIWFLLTQVALRVSQQPCFTPLSSVSSTEGSPTSRVTTNPIDQTLIPTWMLCDLGSFDTSNTGGGGGGGLPQTLFLLHCVVSSVKTEKPSERGRLSSPSAAVQSVARHRGWSVDARLFKRQRRGNTICVTKRVLDLLLENEIRRQPIIGSWGRFPGRKQEISRLPLKRVRLCHNNIPPLSQSRHAYFWITFF